MKRLNQRTPPNPHQKPILKCAKSAHGSFRGGDSIEGRINPGLSERVIMRVLGGC